MSLRKTLSLLLALSLILVVATGCEPSAAPASSPAAQSSAPAKSEAPAQSTAPVIDDKPLAGKTITFWMQKYGASPDIQLAFLDSIVADFYEETGITVEYSTVDWGQASTKYTLAATGGEAPDVADTFYAYSWAEMGGLLEIDDVVAEIGDDGFYDFAKPECWYNGHWYGLPWRGDTRIAMYNTQMFEEAGITEFPKTYDELLEAAKKLTTYDSSGEVDRAGLAFMGSKGNITAFGYLFSGFHDTYMNQDYTKFTFFDSPAAKDALKFWQDAIYVHKIVPTTVLDPTYSGGDNYMAGKAAIGLGFNADTMINLQNNAPQIAEVTKSHVMPSVDGKGVSSIAFAAPTCIFNSTKEPEAAKEWLKYWVSKDVQLEACKQLGVISVWKDVMADSHFSDSEWYRTFLDQNERATPGDMPIPQWSQLKGTSGPLNQMLTKITAGEDIEDSLEWCRKEFETIMNS